MQFIDSHAHINDKAFDADRADVIQRVFESGVYKFVEIGCETAEWEPALALCAQYPQRTAAVLGVHPQMAHTYDTAARRRLEDLFKNPQAVAVGEIGLDCAYLHVCPQDTQLRVFEEMLGFASQIQKPIVLHVRREGEDYTPYEQTFGLLKHCWKPAPGKYPGVLHCFSARYEEAKKALDQGLLLGINGCFTYKKNEYIREAVKKAGADKLVLETDCPYLAPVPWRGKTNEPALCVFTAECLAGELGMSTAELWTLAGDNARRFFGM